MHEKKEGSDVPLAKVLRRRFSSSFAALLSASIRSSRGCDVDDDNDDPGRGGAQVQVAPLCSLMTSPPTGAEGAVGAVGNPHAVYAPWGKGAGGGAPGRKLTMIAFFFRPRIRFPQDRGLMGTKGVLLFFVVVVVVLVVQHFFFRVVVGPVAEGLRGVIANGAVDSLDATDERPPDPSLELRPIVGTEGPGG